MAILDRHDFIACLGGSPDLEDLEVFTHSRRHLIKALDEVGFEDFRGLDYEVMGRLGEALRGIQSEPALWGLVFIDLWYCSNFGGQHWSSLVARDVTNLRYAIEAAHWVVAESGSDGGATLAALINRCRGWGVAEQYVRLRAGTFLRGWWQHSVLPHKTS